MEQIDRVLTDFGCRSVRSACRTSPASTSARASGSTCRRSARRARKARSRRSPDRLFEMGRYGQKTGAGWYRYERRQPRRASSTRWSTQLARRGGGHGAGSPAGWSSDDEILARITTALANEGARVLEDGFALRAGDIDVIYCYGFGFPATAAGPMFYADTVGLAIGPVARSEYRARFGPLDAGAALERLVVTAPAVSGLIAPRERPTEATDSSSAGRQDGAGQPGTVRSRSVQEDGEAQRPFEVGARLDDLGPQAAGRVLELEFMTRPSAEERKRSLMRPRRPPPPPQRADVRLVALRTTPFTEVLKYGCACSCSSAARYGLMRPLVRNS